MSDETQQSAVPETGNEPAPATPNPKLRSPEERRDILKSLFNKEKETSATSRAKRRLLSQPAGTLLLGVALHAAARHAEGLELSSLESKLFDMMRTFAPEDEISEYGKMYADIKTNRSGSAGDTMIPDSVLDTDIATSYTQDDVWRDIARISEQSSSGLNANLRVVGAEKPEGDIAKTRVDTTIYAAPGEQLDRPPMKTQTSPLNVRVVLTKFECKEESTEGSGSDEVYWSLTSGGDHGYTWTYKSPKFGDVDRGETKYFDQHAKVFEGPVNTYASATIQAWEKDDSGSQWIEDLRKGLRWLGDGITETSQYAAAANMKLSAYGDAIGIICLGVEKLIGWLTNQDDFIAEHHLVWTRSTLEQLASSGEETMQEFYDWDSGTHHLYFKVLDLNKIGLEETMTAWVRGEDGRWTQDLYIPAPDCRHGSLVVYENRLIALMTRESDGCMLWSEREEGSWSWPRSIGGTDMQAYQRPVGCVGSSERELFIAYRGKDNFPRLIHTTAGGKLETWSSLTPQNYAHQPIWSAPGLAYYSHSLWYSIRKSTNQPKWACDTVGLYRIYAGDPSFHEDPLPEPMVRGQSKESHTLIVYRSNVWGIFRGGTNEIWICRRYGPSEWEWFQVPDMWTEFPPTACVHQDRVYVIAHYYRSDGKAALKSKYWDGTEWHEDGSFATPTQPGGVASWKNQVWATHCNY